MGATLKQLEAFVAIARTGSFSAAARIVHVSQPALTTVIKNLEQQLGVALFDRTARGVTMTTAGRELLPTVDRLLTELNETLANVLSGTAPRGGTVTLACVPSAGSLFLPPLIASFNRQHPTVRIDMRDAMTENREIVRMVRSGDIDCGVASPMPDAAELQFRHLYDDELVAILPPSQVASAQKNITWKQLSELPLVGMASHSYLRLLIDQTFAAIGISKRPVAEVSLITTAVGMARAGLGAAVLPLRAARACDLAGVTALGLVEPTVRRPIGFLYRSMAELSPATKAFMKHALGSDIR
ncbi:LysR family transcriptional regulator [Caenimonas soli]|uniref:LysR family transcriptional regulator n=1 Tax=Caenimonas soli TaxID=2735555 RepID=UPI0015525571|nr:LysR family transcriptional regulator [Caenimonas soli]NPC58748.1 LysR family transcriptional regulator [Caenimonas soli]